jgi:hypothetical protein
MCIQTTPVQNKQTPARYARWLDGKAEARELLMSGKAARLLIVVTLANGKQTTNEYVVYRTDAAWILLKEVSGRVAAKYSVDVTFSQDPGEWHCDCKDALWHPSRQCKHAAGLVASLKDIGIIAI